MRSIRDSLFGAMAPSSLYKFTAALPQQSSQLLSVGGYGGPFGSSLAALPLCEETYEVS